MESETVAFLVAFHIDQAVLDNLAAVDSSHCCSSAAAEEDSSLAARDIAAEEAVAGFVRQIEELAAYRGCQ